MTNQKENEGKALGAFLDVFGPSARFAHSPQAGPMPAAQLPGGDPLIAGEPSCDDCKNPIEVQCHWCWFYYCKSCCDSAKAHCYEACGPICKFCKDEHQAECEGCDERGRDNAQEVA